MSSTIRTFGSGKKALFYSDGTGCKSGSKRQIEVTFTDETGTAAKASNAAGKC